MMNTIKHTIGNIRRRLWQCRKYWMPGALVFFVLFLVSNVMNFTLSYMGNTNEEVVRQIIQRFWWKILYQVLKILIVYLLVGAVMGSLFYASIDGVRSRWRVLQKKGITTIVSVGMLLLYVVFVVTEKLIINPQMYIDNFALHGRIFTSYLEFCTDYIHPMVPCALAWMLVAAAAMLVAVRIRQSKAFSSFNIQLSHHLTRKRIIALIGSIVIISLVWLLYAHKIIFYEKNRPSMPNILVIASDAVRPDHFSGNGYARTTTPNIDALMKKSVQFRGVISALPRTFPAWVSLLTSQYPLTHDIKHMFPRSRERNVLLPSVPKILKDRGYYTAVISDYAGDIFPRIELGFEDVSAHTFNFDAFLVQMMLEKQTFLLPFISNRAGDWVFPELRGIAKYSHHEAVTRETIEAIRSCRGRPFFITTFYSITHFPYAVPYPYYSMYADPSYRGPYKYHKQVLIQTGKSDENLRKEDSEEDKKQVVALYDGALNLLDREIGTIVGYLEKSGLLENTIVVVTSDHGENLYEKNLGMGHGEHLKGIAALEVPFIVYAPALTKDRGKTIQRFSSQIDIMPTIFEAAHFPLPNFFQGVSLLQPKPWRDGEKVDAYCETGLWFDYNPASPLFFHHRRIVYPDVTGLLELDSSYRNELVIMQKYQNITNAAKHRAIIAGRYKLIYVPLPHGCEFELYDQIADPYNERDISTERKDVLVKMKKLFYDFIQEKSHGNLLVRDGFIFPVFSDPVF